MILAGAKWNKLLLVVQIQWPAGNNIEMINGNFDVYNYIVQQSGKRYWMSNQNKIFGIFLKVFFMLWNYSYWTCSGSLEFVSEVFTWRGLEFYAIAVQKTCWHFPNYQRSVPWNWMLPWGLPSMHLKSR